MTDPEPAAEPQNPAEPPPDRVFQAIADLEKEDVRAARKQIGLLQGQMLTAEEYLSEVVRILLTYAPGCGTLFHR